MVIAKLTLKQKRFADEYIISGNATEAAIKAGYSKKTAKEIGAQNLTKLHISKYLDEQLAELNSKTIATKEEVLSYLTSVMRGEQTEQTLRGTGAGAQSIIDIDVGAKDRIKAAELLGKRHRLWTDKQELSMDGPVVLANSWVDDHED